LNIPPDYRNLKEIAETSNKLLRNWISQPAGKEQIAAFAESHPEIESPIITKRGKGGGTYAHPQLAAIFAVWCNSSLPADHLKIIEMAAERIKELEKRLENQANNPPIRYLPCGPGFSDIEFKGHQVQYSEVSERIQLTAIARIFGVKVLDWMHTPEGEKLIDSVSRRLKLMPYQILAKFPKRGTWAHPLVAIGFCKWISKEAHAWAKINIKPLIINEPIPMMPDPTIPIRAFKDPANPTEDELSQFEWDEKRRTGNLRISVRDYLEHGGIISREFAIHIAEQNQIIRNANKLPFAAQLRQLSPAK
jgi:KilA-N domain